MKRRPGNPEAVRGIWKSRFSLKVTAEKADAAEDRAMMRPEFYAEAAQGCHPSGISPSPQALSMAGEALSATTTPKPFWRAARAAASPAGPPPITKTSISEGNRLIVTIAARSFPRKIRGPWPRARRMCRVLVHGSSEPPQARAGPRPRKDFRTASGNPTSDPARHLRVAGYPGWHSALSDHPGASPRRQCRSALAHALREKHQHLRRGSF